MAAPAHYGERCGMCSAQYKNYYGLQPESVVHPAISAAFTRSGVKGYRLMASDHAIYATVWLARWTPP